MPLEVKLKYKPAAKKASGPSAAAGQPPVQITNNISFDTNTEFFSNLGGMVSACAGIISYSHKAPAIDALSAAAHPSAAAPSEKLRVIKRKIIQAFTILNSAQQQLSFQDREASLACLAESCTLQNTFLAALACKFGCEAQEEVEDAFQAIIEESQPQIFSVLGIIRTCVHVLQGQGVEVSHISQRNTPT
jgi:hypothetical protein